MNKAFKVMIDSMSPPRVELTDAGLYVRFLRRAKVARTAVESVWPHVAVDLDRKGRVIGIEAVPAPKKFSVGMIPKLLAAARVGGLPKYLAEDVKIEPLSAA